MRRKKARKGQKNEINVSSKNTKKSKTGDPEVKSHSVLPYTNHCIAVFREIPHR